MLLSNAQILFTVRFFFLWPRFTRNVSKYIGMSILQDFKNHLKIHPARPVVLGHFIHGPSEAASRLSKQLMCPLLARLVGGISIPEFAGINGYFDGSCRLAKASPCQSRKHWEVLAFHHCNWLPDTAVSLQFFLFCQVLRDKLKWSLVIALRGIDWLYGTMQFI